MPDNEMMAEYRSRQEKINKHLAERYEQEYEQHAERSQAARKGWKTRRDHYEKKVMQEKKHGKS